MGQDVMVVYQEHDPNDGKTIVLLYCYIDDVVVIEQSITSLLADI